MDTNAPLPHLDCAYIPGQRHLDNALPCQDYALTGNSPRVRWGVISDGCSSGGRTDLGARLWAHAADRVVRREGLGALDSVHGFIGRILPGAERLLRPFEFDDGYATLGVAASDGKTARVHMYGDGAVVALRRDGTLTLWVLNYARNAPRYLNYERNAEALSQWLSLTGHQSLMVVRSEYLLDSGERDDSGEPVPELQGLTCLKLDGSSDPGFALTFEDTSQLQGLLLFTDGVSSFKNLTTLEALRPFLSPAVRGGRFLHKTLHKLERTWAGQWGQGPADDLAVAGLWFPKPSAE